MTTHIAVYRAEVSGLTDAQFKALYDAAEQWRQASPDNSVPRFNRNLDTGLVTVEVRKANVSKPAFIDVADALDTAVSNLPGEWPPVSDTIEFLRDR
jgi:hypothetical protein